MIDALDCGRAAARSDTGPASADRASGRVPKRVVVLARNVLQPAVAVAALVMLFVFV